MPPTGTGHQPFPAVPSYVRRLPLSSGFRQASHVTLYTAIQIADRGLVPAACPSLLHSSQLSSADEYRATATTGYRVPKRS
jgi:hypothetical protein